MRYAGHEPAPGGSRTSRGSRSPWGPADGPGRMASRQGPRRARQPHAGAAASPSARIEPGREHLAVLARQLVVEPRVRLLRRHRRPLLLRVEPPHRPALDHHVHRPLELGQCIQCMMISAGWYKLAVGIILAENEEAVELKRWFAELGDVREDVRIAEEVLAFIDQFGVRSVAMVDRIIGCPHEEGIDYHGPTCPLCPFWAGRDRWSGERVH